MSGFENNTLSQRIADEITVKISEGVIKPGERLLENDLMDVFRTSRAPIREALFILEKDGLAERIPRRGVFVKSYTKELLHDLYDAVYRLQDIALRKLIETVPENSLDRLDQVVTQMESFSSSKNVKIYNQLVEEFTLLLFDLAGNRVIKEFYLKIVSQLVPFRYISLSHPSSMDSSSEEFRQIMIGLREKDYDMVEWNMQKKEKRALSILEKVLDGYQQYQY